MQIAYVMEKLMESTSILLSHINPFAVGVFAALIVCVVISILRLGDSND